MFQTKLHNHLFHLHIFCNVDLVYYLGRLLAINFFKSIQRLLRVHRRVQNHKIAHNFLLSTNDVNQLNGIRQSALPDL